MTEIRQLVSSPDAGAEKARLRHLIAHRLAATRSRRDELESLAGTLERVYIGLLRGPRGRHVGDCDCISLEPMPEEVITMATELEQVKAAVCSCGCEMCATSGTNCGCGCCGVSVAGSEPKSGASKALSQIPLVEASATCTCGCCA